MTDQICNEKQLLETFTTYTVDNHKFPKKKDLVEHCGKSIEEFNEVFRSVTHIRKQFWVNMFEETLFTLAESEEYESYTVRDKMLAFYYTWLEELKPFREYIKFIFSQKAVYQVFPDDMTVFLKSFENYTDTLIEQGKQTGELAKRMLIGNQLKKILKVKLIFVLKFWLRDTSSDSAQTDSAVEKSVHLAFDILGKTAVDTAFDFGKFVLKNRIGKKSATE